MYVRCLATTTAATFLNIRSFCYYLFQHNYNYCRYLKFSTSRHRFKYYLTLMEYKKVGMVYQSFTDFLLYQRDDAYKTFHLFLEILQFSHHCVVLGSLDGPNQNHSCVDISHLLYLGGYDLLATANHQLLSKGSTQTYTFSY